MTVSARSYLTAGVATMVVGAMAIAPVQPSAPASITADTVRLSAAVQPLVNQVNTAAAALGQLDAVATQTQPRAQAAAQANNNVSNAIDAAYSVIMYWADYFALDLGPYLLGWIPFGYLISDQIYIWYPNLTVPVADSFVYDFLDPVVNDPLNPAVWSAGLTSIVQTAVSSLGIVANQEIAYFWSLAWFPFPLPPLPWAATKVAAAANTDSVSEQSAPAGSAVAPATGHSARPQVAKQTPDTVDDATPVAEAVTTTTSSAAGSTKSANDNDTAAASAKSGSATSTGDTGKKRSTAGSARSHGPKADNASKGDGA
jgi:hypothetical protein